MRINIISVGCLVLTGAPAWAQVSSEQPLLIEQIAETPQYVLPANSEVNLRLNEDVTTKGKGSQIGDTFSLSVTHHVIQDGYIVIPAGSRAVGKIAWMTSKGAFGKSGKMDIAIDYVEVAGRRVPLEGTYRQEGEGNTVATVGGIIAIGVFAGFITGKSATIPAGRELIARTKDDLPLQFAARPRAPAQIQNGMVISRSDATAFVAAEQKQVRQNWGLEEVRTQTYSGREY
jgi:hypothetical protein